MKTTTTNAQIESTISELVSITNRSKIYGSRIILGTNRMQTDEIEDLLNQSLQTIFALQNQRDDLLNATEKIIFALRNEFKHGDIACKLG